MKTLENKQLNTSGTLSAHAVEPKANFLKESGISEAFSGPSDIASAQSEVILNTAGVVAGVETVLRNLSSTQEDDNYKEWEEASMKDQEEQVLDAKELMELPLEDRRRILKKATEDIKEEYEEGGNLRKFQALGEGDFNANP